MSQIDPNEPEEALPIHLSMCHRRHLDFNTPPGVKWTHDPRIGGRLINNYFVNCRSYEYYQNGPIYRVAFPDGKERDVMACRVGCCRACAGRAIDETDNRKQPPYVKLTDYGPHDATTQEHMFTPQLVQQLFDRPDSLHYVQLLCSKGSSDGSSSVSVECFVEDHCQECAAKKLGPRRPGEQGGPALPGPSA